jgi:hypothetical protein
MNRSWSRGSIVTIAILSSVLQFPQIAFSRDSTTNLELTLMVYNYGTLSSHQIKEIGARVAFIFDNAGISVKWLDCRPAAEGRQPPAACRQPVGPFNLAIRLFDQAAMSKTGSLVTPLAHSFGTVTGGSYASVFCATVRQFARGDRSVEITLLGHAIAHEIGHLLLGCEAHSNAGIMKAQWNQGELLQIAESQLGLLFSKAQATRLRWSLLSRQDEAEGNHETRLNTP